MRGIFVRKSYDFLTRMIFAWKYHVGLKWFPYDLHVIHFTHENRMIYIYMWKTCVWYIWISHENHALYTCNSCVALLPVCPHGTIPFLYNILKQFLFEAKLRENVFPAKIKWLTVSMLSVILCNPTTITCIVRPRWQFDLSEGILFPFIFPDGTI